MGKPRKIEIDDRIPCNKSEDFVLPRCENIEEIWPALFTKALLKLYSYKFSHGLYNELTDLSFIYSLLGFHVEKIQMNSSKAKYMDHFFIDQQGKDINNFKITTFACMNFFEEDLKMVFPSTNLTSQLTKRNFNFNFKVLDQDKDADTSITKTSVKSKMTNQDSLIYNKGKPKFSSVISKIFNSKKKTNQLPVKPLFKSFGDLFMKKNTQIENFNIPEKGIYIVKKIF